MNDVLNQMLKDRHYECIENLDLYARNSDLLKVFIPNEDKIGINYIKTIINEIENDKNIKTVIIIYKVSVTPFAKQGIMLYQNEHSIKFETFNVKELSFNVTNHEKVPKHELLSSTEAKELYEILKTTQIPRISCNDPVARYFGASVGEVMKISRNSDIAGRCVVYRKVF